MENWVYCSGSRFGRYLKFNKIFSSGLLSLLYTIRSFNKLVDALCTVRKVLADFAVTDDAIAKLYVTDSKVESN